MPAFYKHAWIVSCIVITLISCSSAVSIQSSNSIQFLAYEKNERDSGKKESAFPLSTATGYRNDIPVKVVRSFIKEFYDDENVKWQKTGEDLFVAKFATDSSEKKIDYNRNGTWNHLWIKYNKIPAAIQGIVDDKFCCYVIAHVYGLLVPSDNRNIVYSVLIKHDNNCKTLKIYKGQMEILSDFESDEQ